MGGRDSMHVTGPIEAPPSGVWREEANLNQF